MSLPTIFLNGGFFYARTCTILGLTYELMLLKGLGQGNVVEIVEGVDGGLEPGIVLLVDQQPVQGLINSLAQNV